ncbi:amidase [Lunatibacter salilacus]|uniref:amidase n=1 Tax=Lunatibacter salilacus TaxID=2483804 RepID=UPI001F349F3F|nr:amidase [Lunatibacter salilacus]
MKIFPNSFFGSPIRTSSPLISGRVILFSLMLSGILISGCQNTSPSVDISSEDTFAYLEWEISDFEKAYSSGELTVEKVVSSYLKRIETLDHNGPEIRSVLEINPDAITIAKELDSLLKEGIRKGPLHGIPVLLKDNIDTHDRMHTTAGSRALAGSQPLQDSFVAQKLREAGAVILGKANLSEWANFRGEMSSSGWSGLGGQTKNPYILDRNPCGSSAGSGAAVSANFAVMAIGTETNGSIVCPSTANGIVGIKPTVGLISRSGVIPISYTQDTPGPMTRTVRDGAISLGTMIGLDSRDDKTSASEGKYHTDYTVFLKADGLKGKKIGWLQDKSGVNYKVDALMEQAIAYMESQGAEIIPIQQISASNSGSHSFQVMLFEYKDGLNSYFKSLGDQAPVKSLEELIEFNKGDSIELKHYNQKYLEMAQEKGDLNSPEYVEALEKLRINSQDEGIDKVLVEFDLDAIVAPTGSPAWKTDWTNGDSYHLGSSSPAAHAGYPSITVPMGMIDDLPVGISFFSTAWSEPVLLEVAYSFEQGTKARRAPRFLEGSGR